MVQARKNRGFLCMKAAMRPAPMPAGVTRPRAAPGWRQMLRSAGRSLWPIDATVLIRGMFHKVSDQPGLGAFPPD
ncbi:hypothetical protein D8B30_15105 [Verminephrobacter eiseniae]|nr:hypothetical protein [Verminephrobacter eiseniae]MCW8191053.1 hypothetical protein [Verminephrobacter eiseniae]